MECKKHQNMEWCNCTFKACGKRGICCECVKYHREKNEIPACFFSEEVECGYDRSIENFIADYQSRKDKKESQLNDNATENVGV